jgi:hypothetical protein
VCVSVENNETPGLKYRSSSAANQLQQKDDERYDQKNMDVPRHNMEADEADKPQNEQDDE